MTATHVNLELRRKDKKCFTSDTSAEVLPREEVVQTEEEEINRNPIRSQWLVIANRRRISVPSVKRKDTKKVIV